MNIDNVGIKEKQLEIELDKQIVLKFIKEKRTKRTYIFGLHHFLNSDEITALCNRIKKNLGTGHLINTEGNVVSHGFQGEHIKIIYDFLIKEKIAPPNKIKQMN
jgi:hypothetical protein